MMGPYHVVNFIFVLKLSRVFVAGVVAASVVVLQWNTYGINIFYDTWQVVNPRTRRIMTHQTWE